jgi:antitoxin component of MazEF toxin-antitoxin module
MISYTVRVGKMGNSLRVTIPEPVTQLLEIKKGDAVKVGLNERDEVVISKIF